KPTVSDNDPDIYNAVHRLRRVVTILNLLVEQLGIMETMTPLDFLDFHDLLRPASGFQSIQFKIIEAALGLTYADRFGKEYYLSQLNADDVERVKNAERQESLVVLLNRWLERMPYCEDKKYWEADSGEGHPFWDTYRNRYAESLLPAESANLQMFDTLFMEHADFPEGRRLSRKASQNAFFIMLYRDYPLFQ